jgi:hypothetical protein
MSGGEVAAELFVTWHNEWRQVALNHSRTGRKDSPNQGRKVVGPATSSQGRIRGCEMARESGEKPTKFG